MEAGPGHQSPSPPADHSSGWSVNWTSVIVLAVVAVIAIVAWSWLGSGSDSSEDGSDQADEAATSAPRGTGEDVAPATTTSPPTTTTTPPTTPSTTTTTVASQPRVLIRGEMKPCRFGSNCLVASFTIEGFDEHPGQFVCIYPNSRSGFAFHDDGVDDACLTADEGDTITIEVGGVQSATISEQHLDGIADATSGTSG